MKPVDILFVFLLLSITRGGAKMHASGEDSQGYIQRKAQDTNVHNDEPSPHELCSAFMIYDFVTRKMERESTNGRGEINWKVVCSPLQPLNPQLCPKRRYRENICNSSYRIHLNNSIKYEYCKPLLKDIENDKDRTDCERACVKYVSRDRGDCCQFECE